MRRIIGIDPGRTSGYVDLVIEDDGTILVAKAQEVLWDERFRFKEFLDYYAGVMLPFNMLPDAIVIEAFTLRAAEAHHQVGSDFPSVRIIGLVEAYAYELDILDRIVFQPATLKEFVKKKHELPASEHVLDAYKHARYFIVRERNRGQ